MRNRHLPLVFTLLVALSACSSPADWVTQIGGANNDTVFGIAETDDGRACVTGTFISKTEFGTATHPLKLDSGGYSDIYAACYTAEGAPAFATHFAVTNKNDQPRAIAAMPGGDVLITGFFSNTFGADPDTRLQAPGPANSDVFLARVDDDGNTVWARRYGGSSADSGRALDVDSDGNILLVGSFQDVMPYTENGAGQKMTSAGGRDAFVFKLKPDGQVLWGRRFGGAGSDEAFAVTTGADGTIVVAGTFAGDASGNGGQPVKAVGYKDAFLQGFSTDGELLWTRSFGGEGQEYVTGLAATDDGQFWLAGSFQKIITFTDGATLTSRGSTDAMLVRFDALGNVNRPLSFGGADVELVYAIAASTDGGLLVAGHFQNESDFQPGPGETIYTSSGTNDTDGFVLILDSEGHYRDAVVMAGNDTAIGSGVVATNGGGLAVTGIFGKNMRIKVPGEPTLNSHGKSDVYVLRTAN